MINFPVVRPNHPTSEIYMFSFAGLWPGIRASAWTEGGRDIDQVTSKLWFAIFKTFLLYKTPLPLLIMDIFICVIIVIIVIIVILVIIDIIVIYDYMIIIIRPEFWSVDPYARIYPISFGFKLPMTMLGSQVIIIIVSIDKHCYATYDHSHYYHGS